jgi:hypothetical protein
MVVQADDDGATGAPEPKDYTNEGANRSFDLRVPISKSKDEEFTRVEFRNPNMGMLKVTDKIKGDMESAYALAAQTIIGFSAADVAKLHPDDFGQVQDAVESFFGDLTGRAG